MSRTIVISDVHGQPHLIKNVLKHSKFDKTRDHLIFAGDLIDIGNDPKQCWQLLKDNNAEMLWGNHDAAIVLRKFISPQDPYSWQLYEDLRKTANDFKIATSCDNILITHAGLCTDFYDHHMPINILDEIIDVNELASILNSMSLNAMWHDHSPLWYRPDDYMPYSKIIQISGHTPPSYCRPIKNFYMIDPYTKVGFDKSRYRYAVIEDGNVTIEDSQYINNRKYMPDDWRKLLYGEFHD
jgi:predicted phosphodiesterase